MSANRIFLVCQHHPEPENALLIADRADAATAYEGARDDEHEARTRKWFEKHKHCGRTRDHFKLAYGSTQDWDIAPPAENTPAGAVRLALVNGSGSKPQ